MVAFVASTKLTPTGSSGGTSTAFNTTGANFIVIASGTAQAFSPAYSDNQGNTYTRLTSGYSTTFVKVEVWYCLNPTTNASHTITLSGSGATGSFVAAAYSGIAGVDTGITNGNSGTALNTMQSGSVTPSQNGDLLVLATVIGLSGSSVSSIDSGFSVVDQQAEIPSQSYGSALGAFIQSTAAAINPTETFNQATTNVALQIAAFKASPQTYVPPPGHKPPKPPKSGKPGPKNKPQGYNVDSTGPAATTYRRELAALQRKRFVPGGIIYTLAAGSAAGAGAASAVSANLALAIASAAGAGAASGVSVTGNVAVGTASGAGAASGVALGAALSVGTAAGHGLAIGVSPTLMYAVGQALGFGTASGVSSSLAFSAGVAAGQGRARAMGTGIGRVLPFDWSRAWSNEISANIIQGVGYDPLTKVLRCLFQQPGLVVDVGNLPISVTTAIEMSPNPQAYVLGLLLAARN